MSIRELPEKILEISPELKAEVERLEKQDRRRITSPENGRAGGRKHIQVDLWAKEFLDARYKQGDIYTLRRYAGQWYEFNGSYWQGLNLADLEGDIMGFLQSTGRGEETRLSRAILVDVIENMKSSGLCNLHSGRYKIPCFLPTGESAFGWLPMKNAVIDIEKAAVAAESGEDLPQEAQRGRGADLFCTFGLDYEYDPAATCSKWEKYLAEVQPEEENREILQMMAGLALVPDCRYNVCFFLFGEGGTGKSVFLHVLENLVGKDNCCCVPLSKFCDRFGLAPLTEKLLDIVGDLANMPERGKNLAMEGYLKQVTEGELIPVERKGVDGWEAHAIARLVFATNSMPYFSDGTAGVWDRIRIIPFNQRFRGTKKQNPQLAAELLEELPGIFNWALRGLAKLRKLNYFPDCPKGAELKERHRMSCDHEREFLAEFTEEGKGSWISSPALYDQYKSWTLENGYYHVSNAKFKEAIKRMYPSSYDTQKRTESGRTVVIYNIKKKSCL